MEDELRRRAALIKAQLQLVSEAEARYQALKTQADQAHSTGATAQAHGDLAQAIASWQQEANLITKALEAVATLAELADPYTRPARAAKEKAAQIRDELETRQGTLESQLADTRAELEVEEIGRRYQTLLDQAGHLQSTAATLYNEHNLSAALARLTEEEDVYAKARPLIEQLVAWAGPLTDDIRHAQAKADQDAEILRKGEEDLKNRRSSWERDLKQVKEIVAHAQYCQRNGAVVEAAHWTAQALARDCDHPAALALWQSLNLDPAHPMRPPAGQLLAPVHAKLPRPAWQPPLLVGVAILSLLVILLTVWSLVQLWISTGGAIIVF